VRLGGDPARYKVEPYVLAADVHGVEPHVGRGGWTWYTGSAGWMYRLIVESLLGLRVEGGRLRVQPLLRPGWESYRILLRHGASQYDVRVDAGEAGTPMEATIDGGAVEADGVALVDDGERHELRLRLPPP